MDKRKHTDWTEAIRERLENRELTPTDALWERIEAAAPAGAGQAPHKVRPLAWAGALGAAAAAALAAVLLLRPAGAPDPGRIEVLPQASSAPAAIAEVRDNHEGNAEARPAASANAGVQGAGKPFATFRETSVSGETEGITDIAPIPSESDNVHAGSMNSINSETPVTHSESMADPSQSRTSLPGRSEVSDPHPAMTMEDYLRQEAAAQRRHHRLNAALYASGMPTRNSGSAALLTSTDGLPTYNESLTGNPQIIGGSLTNGITDGPDSSSTGAQSHTGYSLNPDSPNGFDPVKYDEDHYNINGERLNHSRPVSVGLAVSLPLNNRLFLESGVYWSYLHSSSYRIANQSLHFAGIPLKLGYVFEGPGRTSFSLSAGAKAEKCIYATRSGAAGTSGGSIRLKEPGLQFAAVADAAIRYDLTPQLGLFLSPELSYWFTKTQLPTYNTENPLNISLKAGLHLTLGR